MNTREAVAKYGLWATMAGCAAHARLRMPWTLKQSVDMTVASTSQYLDGGEGSDGEYNTEAVNAIANRARMRQP